MARYISIFLTTKYLSSDWFLGCRSFVALFANVKTIKVFLKTFSKSLVASVNFINVFMRSFYAHRSQKLKKPAVLDCLFCTFGIFARKSCAYNVGEIDTRCWFHQHFTNSFWVPISFHQQFTDPNCKHIKAVQISFVHKRC